jgi:hypothetical protein
MKSRTLWRSAGATIALLALLAVAACGVTSVNTGPGASAEPTATPVPPTATATLTPPDCSVTGDTYLPGYYDTLPDPHYTTTQVYADIPLPPLSRIVGDSAAGGQRGYDICSAGTIESITDFMNTHLTSLGWANAGSGTWTKSGYKLNVVINSTITWNINWRDPDIHF